MSSNKPKIGVTGPENGGLAAWWFTKLALMIQGAKAIRIQPKTMFTMNDIQGLIIGGGADINPERYGETGMKELFSASKEGTQSWFNQIATVLFFPFILFIRKVFSSNNAGVDHHRDKLEFELLTMAVEKDLPVMGICRGAQLINIYFGGTLHSDISSFYTEVPKVYSVWPKKDVQIEKSSKLFSILDVSDTDVNALNNQAVDVLGEGLSVAAREKNGIIQAIEHSDYTFLIGVQWHPEYMPQLPLQRRLFKALVRGAGEK